MRTLRAAILVIGFAALAMGCHKKKAATTPATTDTTTAPADTSGGDANPCGGGADSMGNPCGADPCGGGE